MQRLAAEEYDGRIHDVLALMSDLATKHTALLSKQLTGAMNCKHRHMEESTSILCCRTLQAWPTIVFSRSNHVKELDIAVYSTLGPITVKSSRFTLLTILKCTPYVLRSFLSHHVLPELHTVLLHWPRESGEWMLSDELGDMEAELQHLDSKITEWFANHENPFPSLNRLGISWSPKWYSLLEMLYCLPRQTKDRQPFKLGLPSFPPPLLALAVGGPAQDAQYPSSQQIKFAPLLQNTDKIGPFF